MQSFLRSSFYPAEGNIQILNVNFPKYPVKDINIEDVIKNTQFKKEESNHYVMLIRPDIFPLKPCWMPTIA